MQLIARALLAAAGLVFAISLVVAAVLLALVFGLAWFLTALWAWLRGRPMPGFVWRLDPRTLARHAPFARRSATGDGRGDGAAPGRGPRPGPGARDEITDVTPKDSTGR